MVAATRALGRAGWAVSVTAASEHAPALVSRYRSERLVIPEPEQDAPAFTEGVARAVARRGYDVILPGSDTALHILSGFRPQLDEPARRGLPEPDVVARCLNRAALGDAAARVGLTEPESVLCATEELALEAARQLGFPIVVKPVHVVESEAGAVARRAAGLAIDEAELRATVATRGTPLIIQRFATGATVSFGGVALTGEGLVAMAVSRYQRTWPCVVGNAAHSETVAPPAGLAERVAALMTELGWHGLFELELLELGAGRYAALDLNPRVYGSLALAVRTGADLPSVWCAWVRDGTVPAGTIVARPGVRYRWEEAELRLLARAVRARRFGDALRIARPRRRTVHAFFDARDPLPALASFTDRARAAVAGKEQGHVPNRMRASA